MPNPDLRGITIDELDLFSIGGLHFLPLPGLDDLDLDEIEEFDILDLLSDDEDEITCSDVNGAQKILDVFDEALKDDADVFSSAHDRFVDLLLSVSTNPDEYEDAPDAYLQGAQDAMNAFESFIDALHAGLHSPEALSLAQTALNLRT